MNARNQTGGNLRIRAAGFPQIKTVDEFTLTHRPGISKDQVALLSSGRYLAGAGNLIFLGPPGTGKTHLAIALGGNGLSDRASSVIQNCVGLGGHLD
jgi:DNA replication protein DnaC